MSFVKDLFGKESPDVRMGDIDNLIAAKKEENRYLEYKDPRILGMPEQLSQWISAFLNADGGLIIIGVCEDDPNKKEKLEAKILPIRKEFVGKEYTKERVELLISSNIRSFSRPVINVYPVRDEVDVSKAIYLIEVPQGDNPPYQATDGKYYRRLNATKYPMSHSEIADFFGKRRKPVLSLIFAIIKVNIQDSEYLFTLRVLISNTGKAVAKYTTVTAFFDNLDIINIPCGRIQRIDDIRGNLPSLQWDYFHSVIHPTGDAMKICDIELKVTDNNRPFSITYDIVAEDIELFTDRYVYNSTDVLSKAREMLATGGKPTFSH
jgi:hypothetical protein